MRLTVFLIHHSLILRRGFAYVYAFALPPKTEKISPISLEASQTGYKLTSEAVNWEHHRCAGILRVVGLKFVFHFPLLQISHMLEIFYLSV